jgi:hypothetical protein
VEDSSPLEAEPLAGGPTDLTVAQPSPSPGASVDQTVGLPDAAVPDDVAASEPYHHWGETWTGTGTGLRLTSSNGIGVYGQSDASSGSVAGVYGLSKSLGGRGVMGYASPSTGTTLAVYGHSLSSQGRGVTGLALASSGYVHGAYGLSRSPDGVGAYGHASSGSGAAHGVYGESHSSSGRGVNGWAPQPSGDTVGVYGRSQSPAGSGVVGYASAASGGTTGVYGIVQAPEGWAGSFRSSVGNGVGISVTVGKKGLLVQGGTKNAVVATDEGARLLYVEESTEVWFADYGFAQTRDGLAQVAIDPLFAETVDLSGSYYVFLQSYGPAGAYVSERGPQGFTVRVPDGQDDVAFSYRLVAKRAGYAHARLESAFSTGDEPTKFESPADQPAAEIRASYRLHLPLLTVQ